MMIAILCLNVVVLVAVIVLFKEFLSLYKASVLDKNKLYNNLELILDQKQLSLYNAIEAKMAATKSHVMDTKRLMGELPSLIKNEIRGELGQIRLAQASLLEVYDLALGEHPKAKPNDKGHNA